MGDRWSIVKNGVPSIHGFLHHDDAVRFAVQCQLTEDEGYEIKLEPRPQFEMKPTNPKDHVATTRVPLWLLSPVAKAYWSLAQLAGMIKYGAWNWREAGVRASVYVSAMQRHIDAWESGEDTDPVDGTHHLGNVMACAAILLDAREAGKLLDDRPPIVGIRFVYKNCESLAAKLFEQYRDNRPRHYTIKDTLPPGYPIEDTLPPDSTNT